MIDSERVSTTTDQKSLEAFDLWVMDVKTLNAAMEQVGKARA